MPSPHPSPPHPRARRIRLGLLLAPWTLGLLLGGLAIVRYATTEGRRGGAPEVWPEGALIQPREGRWTVLMFAHPQCPCTAASLRELGGVVARAGDGVDAFALFLDPEERDAAWTHGPAWRVGEAQSGLECLSDPEGVEAARFGAWTSGQVVAYSPSGRLAFQGGVTGTRGHDGPNPGRSALEAALRGASPGDSAPVAVFGCPIAEEPTLPACSTSLPRPYEPRPSSPRRER